MSVGAGSWIDSTTAMSGSLPPAEWLLGLGTWVGLLAVFGLIGGVFAVAAVTSRALSPVQRVWNSGARSAS